MGHAQAWTASAKESREAMPVSVTMPQLGESVTEGTVTRWLKREGERVEADEPLLEVSTDKVDTEIPSPVSGTVRGITVAEDETVAVGAELAVIDEDGAASGSGGAPAYEQSPYQTPYPEPAPQPVAEPAGYWPPEQQPAAAYVPQQAPEPGPPPSRPYRPPRHCHRHHRHRQPPQRPRLRHPHPSRPPRFSQPRCSQVPCSQQQRGQRRSRLRLRRPTACSQGRPPTARTSRLWCASWRPSTGLTWPPYRVPAWAAGSASRTCLRPPGHCAVPPLMHRQWPSQPLPHRP